jgi:hypothetical protein
MACDGRRGAEWHRLTTEVRCHTLWQEVHRGGRGRVAMTALSEGPGRTLISDH